jgi:hypothetical protein
MAIFDNHLGKLLEGIFFKKSIRNNESMCSVRYKDIKNLLSAVVVHVQRFVSM